MALVAYLLFYLIVYHGIIGKQERDGKGLLCFFGEFYKSSALLSCCVLLSEL